MEFSFHHLKDQWPSAFPDPHPLDAQTATPGPARHLSAGTLGLSQEGLGVLPVPGQVHGSGVGPGTGRRCQFARLAQTPQGHHCSI